MLVNIDPNLITIGPFVLSWHGLFTAVGLAAGVWIAARLLRGTSVPEDEVMTTAFWCTIGGLVGARLLHVIDQWDYYSQRPLQILLLNEGGIAILGAVIGGTVGGVVYALVRRLPVGLLADAGAVGLILGQAIGRIGDVINGEHHGTHLPADTPWAVTYVHPKTLGEPGVANHLAVGYELGWDLLIYGLLLGLWGRLPRPGMLFWLYLLLYSAGRFLINFARQDPAVMAGLAQAQIVSLVSVVIAVWGLIYLMARAARSPVVAGDERPLVAGGLPGATEPAPTPVAVERDSPSLPAAPSSSGDRPA
jgi:phosphatidylglycerol:prolipoprotein diacylglycerol transferase